MTNDHGVLSVAGAADGSEFASQLIAAIAQHRFRDRPGQLQVVNWSEAANGLMTDLAGRMGRHVRT